MKMEIDFYSKDEMAIQIDFSGRYPFPETETSELFLLACYTLRQLSNLGQHPVAKALAGLLVSKSSIAKLLQDPVELPRGKDLHFYLKFHVSSVVAKTRGAKESLEASLAVDSELGFNQAVMQILDTEFLAKAPQFVTYNGKGSKTFEVTLPPFSLSAKGFGIFGRDVNYYAFHSVIGLIRLLGRKHSDDEVFFDHLVQVAQLCGSAHVFHQIPADQAAFANTILKQVGIS